MVRGLLCLMSLLCRARESGQKHVHYILSHFARVFISTLSSVQWFGVICKLQVGYGVPAEKPLKAGSLPYFIVMVVTATCPNCHLHAMLPVPLWNRTVFTFPCCSEHSNSSANSDLFSQHLKILDRRFHLNFSISLFFAQFEQVPDPWSSCQLESSNHTPLLAQIREGGD